jgi:hypothetical protein
MSQGNKTTGSARQRRKPSKSHAWRFGFSTPTFTKLSEKDKENLGIKKGKNV